MHKLTYKDKDYMNKCKILINVRGSIAKMECGDIIRLKKSDYKIRVVRSAASDIGNEYNRTYSVSSPKDSDLIKITRIS